MEGDGDQAVEALEVADDLISTLERWPDDDVSSAVPAKRKAQDGQEEEWAGLHEEASDLLIETMVKVEDGEGKGEGEDAVQYASVVRHPTQPKVTAPPPKKKAKAKVCGKSAKRGLKEATSDRASIATDDMGTPDVDTPKEKKKQPKKKGLAKGKKRKAATELSASSTPAPDQADIPTPEVEADESQDEGDDVGDENKVYCVCKSTADDGGAMIECDHCDEWFHAQCMNIEEENFKLVAWFFCPQCEPLTPYKTLYYPRCHRQDCTKPVKIATSRYCSDECGLIVAASRILKAKQLKGMTTMAVVEKLSTPVIMASSKKEGVAEFAKGASEQRQWLNYKLDKDDIPLAHIDDLDDGMLGKANGMPEMELLSRMESRRAELETIRSSVNASLDALTARTKLLHLAEDRAPQLEPIQDEEESRPANGKKGSSKGKKIKEEDEVILGQPRCGYDSRLSWNDARFYAWSQTTEAKDILDERIKLNGTICIDAECLPDGEVAICGRARRKCKQHLDWSGIRSAELETDRDEQIALLSSLNDEEQQVTERVKQLRHLIRETVINEEERRRERDAALARQLASEGTRRAITSM